MKRRRTGRSENPPERRDGLFEAVVGDGHVLPCRGNQIVLGDDLSGLRHQPQQHVELALGDRDRFAGLRQAPPRRIERERLEDEGAHRAVRWNFRFKISDLRLAKRKFRQS